MKQFSAQGSAPAATNSCQRVSARATKTHATRWTAKHGNKKNQVRVKTLSAMQHGHVISSFRSYRCHAPWRLQRGRPMLHSAMVDPSCHPRGSEHGIGLFVIWRSSTSGGCMFVRRCAKQLYRSMGWDVCTGLCCSCLSCWHEATCIAGLTAVRFRTFSTSRNPMIHPQNTAELTVCKTINKSILHA